MDSARAGNSEDDGEADPARTAGGHQGNWLLGVAAAGLGYSGGF